MKGNVAEYGNELLEQFMTSPAPAEAAPHEVLPLASQSPPPQHGLKKVSYTHDAMIDLMIAQPGISQNLIASHFGYTASWISQIISSDMFQARLAERKAELVDPTISATIEERFKGITLRSMEILAEKLSKPVNDIPDNLALRAFELSTRAAGYGAKVEQKVENHVHNHLEVLADNLTGLLRRKKVEVIEAEYHALTQDSPQAKAG